jgi:soluble lytic murein transglycosylase-like protein
MSRVLCVILCLVAIVASVCIMAYCAQPSAEAVVEFTVVETTEVATEPTETEAPTTVATEPSIELYDVPLDEELQLHIIATAEEYGIDPAIIFAMACRESRYRPGVVGDNGRSFGLLQIQKKWHKKRMQKLGCTDLLDPYQNVTVGVDYLAEQTKRYGGNIAKGLTAYNRGHYAGTVTKYAKAILAHAEKLNKGRSQ